MKLTKDNISEVLAALTLEQKVKMVAAQTTIYSQAFEEPEIPGVVLMEAPTGMNFGHFIIDAVGKPDKTGQPPNPAEVGFLFGAIENTREAVTKLPEGSFARNVLEELNDRKPKGEEPVGYPVGELIAATFNPEMAEKCGQAVGTEHLNYGGYMIMGPNVDIQRDPLGGRNYEMYGEDPYLIRQNATAFIKGMQSVGAAGCAKHFAANNQETNRNTVNSMVSERAMRELYLQGFEAAAKEGKVATIMSAYNKLNGTYCSYDKWLMTDILRDEWGYEGCLVSDWGAATENKDEALNAGMDLILPGPQETDSILAAVKDGRLTEDNLDMHVRRVLELVANAPACTGDPIPAYDVEAQAQAAYDTVVDGSILLKNDGVLPLDPAAEVTLFGKMEMHTCGGGSTNVYSLRPHNLFESVKAFAGEKAALKEWTGDVLIYNATAYSQEGKDRPEMDLDAECKAEIQSILAEAKQRGMKTVVVLNVAGAVDMRRWKEYADAILCVFFPGTEGARATTDMLYGVKEPAGRLPVTFPVKHDDAPTAPVFPAEFEAAAYGEDIYVGYRYYDKVNKEVAYPFGYGLGYTDFAFTIPEQSPVFMKDVEETVSVQVEVTNIGSRQGSTVVQLYVSKPESVVTKPVQELKAFRKVTLDAGESAQITLTLNRHSFESFDTKLHEWTCETGSYDLRIGTSSRDMVGVIPLTIKGKNPYGISEKTPVGEVLAKPEAVKMIIEAVPTFAEFAENPPFLALRGPIGNLLDGMVIVIQPDAVAAKKITAELFEKLSEL